MIAIRHEIGKVESGLWPKDDNPLKNAPHTAQALLKTDWPHAYSREEAAYPVAPRCGNRRTGRRWSAWTTCMATATCFAVVFP